MLVSSRVFLSAVPWALALVAMQAFSKADAAPPKVDYFFPAGGQRGTTVSVTATGTFERWPVKAWTGAKGVEIKPGKTKGELAITLAPDAEVGPCWIRLHDDQGAAVARPFFVGGLPEVLEKEPNDDPKKPQMLGQSSVVNGRLEKPGDVDTFAISLKKGQTLVASLEAHRTLRSPMDGVLQVLSDAGFVLEQNDDYHGLDPQIAFVAPRDGTYLVRVFAFPDKADASIRFAGKETFVYRLTMTTGPYVEYVYPLSVTRDAPASVELVGWNISDAMRIFSFKSAGPERVFRIAPAQVSEALSVQVEGHATFVKSKATREAPQEIPIPATVTGRLDRKGDVDVYQFSAKKGQKFPFRIESRTLGFPLDPVLRVTDGAGKSLAQAQAKAIGADPTLDFTATADGVYRVEVRDLFSDGSFRHVYRLHAGPAPGDFELKVTDDRFTLAGGKTLEIPVTVTRLGGFKQEITLGVEGLPKDVTMTTTAKGITLQAKGPSSAFGGPLRIVGTSKDGTTRFARATIAELARPTEDLWITVTSKP